MIFTVNTWYYVYNIKKLVHIMVKWDELPNKPTQDAWALEHPCWNNYREHIYAYCFQQLQSLNISDLISFLDLAVLVGVVWPAEMRRCMCNIFSLWFNTLMPRRNGQHFADDIFKHIFFNENVWISIRISLKFVPKGPINDIPALGQIMAWRRPGDKPLSEPMMLSLMSHIWPQYPCHVECCNVFYYWLRRYIQWTMGCDICLDVRYDSKRHTYTHIQTCDIYVQVVFGGIPIYCLH